MRPHASQNCDKPYLFFSFKSLNLLRNIQWLRKCRVNTHKHVPYEKIVTLIWGFLNLKFVLPTWENLKLKFVLPTWKKQRVHSSIYIYKLLYATYRSEWIKRICLEWSRGQHFSPSLPGDRYLVLGFKSDLRDEISGSIVWYNALALRPEVLRSFSSFYGNLVVWGYKWNRQKPRLSWSRLFLWSHFKFVS